MKNNSLKIYVEVIRKLASNTFHILFKMFWEPADIHIALYSDM